MDTKRPSETQRQLGLSHGHLEAIKLRLLDLPHSAWKRSGDSVVRASLRGEGDVVAETQSPAVADLIAHAPADMEALVLELDIARQQVEKLKVANREAERAALEARAECGQWREKCTEMRSAWRTLNTAMGQTR